MEQNLDAGADMLAKIRPYVRRELVFLALGIMDVCAITPVYAGFLAPLMDVTLWTLLAGLLAVVLAVHYLARLLFWHPIGFRKRSTLLGLGIAVSGAIAVQRVLYPATSMWSGWLASVFRSLRKSIFAPEATVFLLTALLWWRGLALAQRRTDSASVAFRFRLGVVLLAITTGIAGATLAWPYHQLVFLFFFVSLLGTALARADEIGEQYGGRRAPFGLGWLMTMAVVSGLVLALAAALTSLMTGKTLGRVLLPALQVLQVAVFLIIYALAWLAQFLIQPLIMLLQRFRIGQALADTLDQIEFPSFGTSDAEPKEPALTAGQLEVIRLVVAVLGALAVLALVAISLSRLRRTSRGAMDGARESVWEGFRFKSAVEGLLNGGRQRLQDVQDALRTSRVSQLFAALTIRRTYAHMASLATRLGYPRQINETPYDYLPTLKTAFPEAQADATLITESYVLVHYGELPERTEDLAQVRSAWDRIRRHYATVAGKATRNAETL